MDSTISFTPYAPRPEAGIRAKLRIPHSPRRRPEEWDPRRARAGKLQSSDLGEMVCGRVSEEGACQRRGQPRKGARVGAGVDGRAGEAELVSGPELVAEERRGVDDVVPRLEARLSAVATDTLDDNTIRLLGRDVHAEGLLDLNLDELAGLDLEGTAGCAHGSSLAGSPKGRGSAKEGGGLELVGGAEPRVGGRNAGRHDALAGRGGAGHGGCRGGNGHGGEGGHDR
mmetsp:Transcript_13986/g.44422  ORF Transcript_13986/g.44422 Transcript_13986/m.44422 type:complete len:227 (+) Transcript_13986:732-1412(+)